MAGNNWNPVEMRDNRYNQILHLVSAANGAEDFYSTEVSCMPLGRLALQISPDQFSCPHQLIARKR